MKSLHFFIIFSVIAHGFVFFSFHMFGEDTQSKNNFGKQRITQFEVRSPMFKQKKTRRIYKTKKLTTHNKSSIPTTEDSLSDTTEKEQQSGSALKKTESLASIKGLIGVSRPLTDTEKYKVYIYRKIYNSIDYPEAAQKLRQEGLVVVKVKISNSGQFIADVQKECPFSRLNKAAKRTFTLIGSFKPFPKGFNENGWEITVPIHYNLEKPFN